MSQPSPCTQNSHQWGEWVDNSCQTIRVCSLCRQRQILQRHTNHGWIFEIIHDSAHRKACSVCGLSAQEQHQWKLAVSSVTEEGRIDEAYVCVACGLEMRKFYLNIPGYD